METGVFIIIIMKYLLTLVKTKATFADVDYYTSVVQSCPTGSSLLLDCIVGSS